VAGHAGLLPRNLCGADARRLDRVPSSERAGVAGVDRREAPLRDVPTGASLRSAPATQRRWTGTRVAGAEAQPKPRYGALYRGIAALCPGHPMVPDTPPFSWVAGAEAQPKPRSSVPYRGIAALCPGHPGL